MNWTFCDGERFSHSQSYPVVDSVYPRLPQRWLGVFPMTPSYIDVLAIRFPHSYPLVESTTK